MENLVVLHTPIFVKNVGMCVLWNVHILESTRNIHALDLKGNSCLGDFKKTTWIRLIPKWLSLMQKMAADSKTKGKKSGYAHDLRG